MPQFGQFIGGRYQVLQELGSGGFGKTYLAKDTELHQQPLCVVKHLQIRFNSPSLWQNAKERFVTEAKVLKRLGSHDCIPQLIAYLEEDGEFYLIQELINGEEFRQEISRQRLTEAQIVCFLKGVLEILSFVHQQGVIHRDIKPSNLMRRRSDSKMVLIDFGAVKEIGTLSFNAETQTLITKAIGTPGYMAPEQLNGKPTYSSDIYALGRTAITALTGQSPVELEDTRSGELKHWEEIAQVSPKLVTILNKMICPKLSDRYHSAAQVLEDLQPLSSIDLIIGGRYKLTRYLGGSNGSETYRATNLMRHYQSDCLVKQLQIRTNDPAILEDIESRIVDRLNRLEKMGSCSLVPNLWDRFEEGHYYYLVWEFIDGIDLGREIQTNQRLSEETITALLQDVLETLVCVHQQKFVHGNIKPANLIRRQQDNRFALTDPVYVREILTILAGETTRDFETPEDPPPEKPSASGDIYALGMTAIEALTGIVPDKLPRDPKTQELLWHERASVDRNLIRIIDKMVQADASKRYSSASKVLTQLSIFSRQSAATLSTQSTQRTKIFTNTSRWTSWFDPHDLKIRYSLAILVGAIAILGVWELFIPTFRPMLMAQQGDRQLREEQPEKALATFKEILSIDPKNAKARKGEGDAYFALERYQDALKSYDRALDLQPGDAEAWRKLGDTLYRLERYEAALANYDKSLSLNPYNAETLNRKGRALYNLERYQDALAAQDEALTRQGNYAEALSDRGIALIGLRRYEDALASFNKAQSVKPLEPKFWQNKALALQYLGRRKEALDVYEEALVAYDKTLESKPTNATAWVDRGNVLIKLQRPQEALDSYEKALKIEPDSYLAWLSKGNALFPLGRYNEALIAFDRALEIRPESYLTWHNRGSLLRDGKKDFDEAIQSYDRAIAINRNFYPAWRDRGLALSQANRQQEAIESFDSALKIEPDDYQSWIGRGIALSSLNRRAEALAAFDKAVALQPGDPFAWMNKGMALEQWGRSGEARDAYQKALDLDPKFQPAIDALERLR